MTDKTLTPQARSRVAAFALLVSMATLLAVLAFGTRPALAASGYTLQNLGTLGGAESKAWGVNDSGQVVGDSLTGGQQHAFLWEDGQMRDLGALDGSDYSYATGINTSGQVVGESRTAGGQQHAFLWEDGQMRDLGALDGSDYSYATDVNDSGQVSGLSNVASGWYHAFLWEDGQMRDLGTLGGPDSAAYGINNLGQVVGMSSIAGGDDYAFLWEDGQMRPLGPPGSQMVYAVGINDSSQVVGYMFTPGGNRAYLWEDGQTQDLGTLDGFAASRAYGINNSGQVVGESYTASGLSHAFLWENGQMQDLNDLIPGDSGWVLQTAQDINGSGQIVGVGRLNGGAQRAYLLTPEAAPQDTTDPTSTITTPADGAAYALGQQVTADYSCEDEPGGSGMASCEGNVPDGSAIDTTTPGTYTFVVEAADNAGNQSAATHSYTVSPEPPTDTTRPTVTSTSPQEGATGVPPAANLTATFSEPMDAATVNKTTFKLFRKEGTTNIRVTGVAVSYSAADARATLDPKADLVPGAKYVAKVTMGATDASGNRLAQTKSFRFTVGQ